MATMQKIIVYKLTANGNWCAVKTLSEAFDLMCGEIEAELEDPRKGNESSEFKIIIDEMTAEKFDNLPRFEGF